MPFFITAIGTDSGKTVVSAIMCEALKADYWKPVQSGLPRDTDTVRMLVSNDRTVFHPEQFLLSTPASPHAAALRDQVSISVASFKLPHTNNQLVIEGAGGCLVPLSDEDLMIDLIAAIKAEVIVVSNHYLGSINHTLLTLEALHSRNLTVSGIVFNGETNPESERLILLRSRLPCLLRIKKEPVMNQDIVRKYAHILMENWNDRLQRA